MLLACNHAYNCMHVDSPHKPACIHLKYALCMPNACSVPRLFYAFTMKHAKYPLVLHACTLYKHKTGITQVCTMHVYHNMHARYCKHACYMLNISSGVDIRTFNRWFFWPRTFLHPRLLSILSRVHNNNNMHYEL